MTKSRKKSGYILIAATLASIVYIMISMAFFTIFSGQFSMISAGRTAMQAQQYADVVANTLKLQSIDDIIAKTGGEIALNDNNKLALNTSSDSETKHNLSDLLGNNDSWADWQYNISIADGPANSTSDADDAIVQKIATVRVFKDGDTLPRYSEEVPLSSQGSDTTGKPPVGSILAYYGNLSNIPSNYHLCDGSNGTPDLRDRFIVGAGSSYGLGYTGGSTSHQISTSELPNLADFLNNTIGVRGSNQINDSGNAVSIINWNWEYTKKREGNNHGWFRNSFTTIAWATNYAFDIRPPYYALYYIMRIK